MNPVISGQCTPEESARIRLRRSGFLQLGWWRSGHNGIRGRCAFRGRNLLFTCGFFLGSGRLGRLGGLVDRGVRRVAIAQPRHLIELPQPFGWNRIGFRVVVDVYVEPVHDVETRIAEEGPQSLAAQSRIDLGAHEGREIGFGRERIHRRQRRGGLRVFDARRRLGPRRRLPPSAVVGGGDDARVWRCRRCWRRFRRQLAARPSREEIVAAHRSSPPSFRRRPSLPSKERGRCRFLGSGR